MLYPEIDRITLRAYCVIQASLFFCLMLSASIALASKEKKNIFLLLGANCFFHLLLDSLQKKWANGVHFMAPFSWDLFSLNLFWPEHAITLLLSISGCFLFILFAFKDRYSKLNIAKPSLLPSFLALLLFTLYLSLPVLFMTGPLNNNNHYMQTLADATERRGKKIEIDRAQYTQASQSIIPFTGESILLLGKKPDQDTILSIKGVFKDDNSIAVEAYHVHSKTRDLFSIIGLVGIFLVWLLAIFQETGTILTRKK